VTIAQSSGFIRHSAAWKSAGTKHVGELAERRNEIEHSQTRNGTAHEVVREQVTNRGYGVREIVVIPERGPGDQQQQKPGLEQQGDE